MVPPEPAHHESQSILKPGEQSSGNSRALDSRTPNNWRIFTVNSDDPSFDYAGTPFICSASKRGMSDGRSATGTPAAANAATLLSGVPVLPEMIAPA